MNKINNSVDKSLFTNPLDILILHLSDEIEIRSDDYHYQYHHKTNDILRYVEQLIHYQDEIFMQKIFNNSKNN
ncbi:hypothetical protein QJ854_gp746 [Moumouvirus goulette]|uniref:Uncharacterized protein n=1 Tax=Moumouvirus goulette TaxID=1247379 RepID=M1PM77_9VIRU|nr:hypothetical protein QJ854_gp746 [Moumouvirus goulette]AGF85036.1 hypothetical protein glt_00227 [Moumouvirus goulette]